MSEDILKITLIGSELAVEGLEFVYRGELEECEGCRMHKVCNNLNPKKRYRIVRIRQDTVHPCNVHHGGVRAVEVIESPIVVLVDAKKAILNSEITAEPACPEIGCPNYDRCFPEGLVEKGKYVVTKISGPAQVVCGRGRSLKAVELTPKSA